MVVYSVRCVVDADAAEAWEVYFRDEHLDDLMQTGCFVHCTFRKEISKDEHVYTSDYYCKTEADLARYQDEYASALKEDAIAKFGGRFTASRTIHRILFEKM